MPAASKRYIFWTLFTCFIIYSIVVYTSGTEQDNGKENLTEQAKKGKLLYQKYNCTSCHQLYGLGGYMGPDLTNTISAPGKGHIYVKALLKGGTQRMPNFQLSDPEIEELTAYLDYVDKTGISPVKYFRFNYDGTIEQEARK